MRVFISLLIITGFSINVFGQKDVLTESHIRNSHDEIPFSTTINTLTKEIKFLYRNVSSAYPNIDRNNIKSTATSSTISVLSDFGLNITSAGTTCQYYTGSLIITPTGGTAPYLFVVNGRSQNNGYFSRLGAGTYTIVVTDANGLTASAIATVTNVFTQPVLSFSTLNPPSSCSAADGSITVSATGGQPPYLYSIDNINYSSTNSFTNLSQGSYFFFVKDANGCIAIKNTELNFYSGCKVALGLSYTGIACKNDASLTIKIINGQPPYAYSMDGINFQSNGDFRNLSSGNKLIYYKDASGFTGRINIYIQQDCTVKIDFLTVDAACGQNNGAITASVAKGQPPYTYTIDGINFQSGNMFTGLAPGNYTVGVKDATGGISSSIATVYDQCPGVYATATDEVCGAGNGTIIATGQKGTQPYQFSLDGIHFQPGNVFTGLIADNYTVTIKDANGFTKTTNVSVQSKCLKVMTTTTPETCKNHNGNITASGSGGVLPYQYSLNGGIFQTSSLFSNLAGGSYTITIRDLTGTTTVATVNVPAVLPAAVSLGNDTTLCPGAILTLKPVVTATNISSYSWQDGSTTAAYVVSKEGRYIVNISADGCNVADTIEVKYFSLIDKVFPVNDTTLCTGMNLTLTARPTGGANLWDDGSTGMERTITAAGKYWVRVTTSGCSVSDTIVAHFNTAPAISLGPDTTLCTGQLLLLRVNTPQNTRFLWSTGADDDSIRVSFSGEYWIAATSLGCTSRDTVEVKYNPVPVFSIGGDTALCEGTGLLLRAPVAAGYSYVWQDGNQLPDYTVSKPGLYFVQVSNSFSCRATDTMQVTYKNLPFFTLGSDTVLCAGKLLRLDQSAVGGTYLWNNGSSDAVKLIRSPGQYWLKVTADGCSRTDTLNVIYKPNPVINLGKDSSLCIGQAIKLDATASNATYLWQDGSISATYQVNHSGTYQVMVTADGCDTTGSITISYTDKPVLHLGADTTLCNGDILVLNAYNPQSSYLWQDGSYNSSFKVTKPGNYIVQINNRCGITQGKIAVNYEACSCTLYVPTGFTPNYDGKNDLFKVLSRCSVNNYSLRIFNRWGNSVFNSADIHRGWDGNVRNTPQPTGIYVWELAYQDAQSKQMIHRTGTVLLLH